ncbi:MAG: nitroreductase family protein [Eubacterium sp.]|nr:nitroreductase family protein [Eubacterium sp.]
MIRINEEKCIGCGACAKDCTRQIIKIKNHKAQMEDDSCNLCGHCYCVCPVEAIEYRAEDLGMPEEPPEIRTDRMQAYLTRHIGGSEEISMAEGRLDPDQLLRGIKSRRSVRHFKREEVECKKLKRIVEAARFVPSGANRQSTEFLIIKEQLPEITRECLSIMGNAAREYLKQEVKTADPERVDFQLKVPGNDCIGGNLVRDYAEKWIEMEQMYRKEGTDRLFYHAAALVVFIGDDLIDAALAASASELMANAEGLGCVYIGFCRFVMNTPKMRKRLGIPDNKEEICCLALGYPDVQYKRTAPRRTRGMRWM